MLIGAGQKALVAGDDQMRMKAAQLLGAEPLLLELAVAKILQEHVGGLEQPVHGVAILGLLEVQHDAALAAVEQREERRAHAAERCGSCRRRAARP